MCPSRSCDDRAGAMEANEERVMGKKSTTRDNEALRRMRQQVIRKHATAFHYTPSWKEVRRDSLDIGLYDPENPLPYYALADTYLCNTAVGFRFSGKIFDPGPCEELEDLGKRQSWNWHLGKNTLATNTSSCNESIENVLLRWDLTELDECCVHVLECPPPYTRATVQNQLQTDEWFQKLLHVMWRCPCKCGRTKLETLESKAAVESKEKMPCYCAQENVIDVCRKKHEQVLEEQNVRHAAHVFDVITHILTAFPVLMAYIITGSN